MGGGGGGGGGGGLFMTKLLNMLQIGYGNLD